MKVPRPETPPRARPPAPVGLAVVCLLALAACAPGRAVEAVSLLRDLSSPPAPGEALAGVTRTAAAIDAGRATDLYRPRGSAPEAALVVVSGAAEAGRRDVRLVAFAADLARAGFLVMVPEAGGDAPLRVSAEDAEAVAGAVRWLTDAAAVPSVGLAGISYAAGPAVLAALRPGVAE